MARIKKTVRFDQAAAQVLQRADKRGKRHSASAVNAWAEVVGSEVSAHTQGFALREGGELVVFVDSGAWANQLTLMSAELIARLNAHIGDQAVRALRFNVSRRVQEGVSAAALESEVDEFYAIDTTNPVTLSELERAQVEAMAASIKDDRLREAALRVMISDLELKKGRRPTSG